METYSEKRGVQWQRNTNGTYYADYNGNRVAVSRVAKGRREFRVVCNGVQVDICDNLALAQASGAKHVKHLPVK